VLTLLLCGLVGFAVAEVTKRILRLRAGRTSWAKVGMALLGSAAVSGLIYRRDIQRVIIYAVAGLALAMLIHKLYRLVSARGDDIIVDIITKRGR
jgi:hypothetical protein